MINKVSSSSGLLLANWRAMLRGNFLDLDTRLAVERMQWLSQLAPDSS